MNTSDNVAKALLENDNWRIIAQFIQRIGEPNVTLAVVKISKKVAIGAERSVLLSNAKTVRKPGRLPKNDCNKIWTRS